jgi:transposase
MIKAGRDVPPCTDGCPVGDGSTARALAPRSASETRRPHFHRRRSLSRQNRNSLARSPGTLRLLEDRVQPVFELVASGTLGSHFQGTPDRSRRRRRHHRRFGRSSPPGRCGRKRGIVSNALGRSRGGFSTKIHALVDTKGRPLHVELTPGQQHESTVAAAIIKNHARGEAFIADTGYDSDAIREQLKSMRIKPVIHANPTRKRKPRLDRRRYASRFRVEIFFHDLKRFRALATRFEKTSRNYLALLHLACSMIWLQDLVGGA